MKTKAMKKKLLFLLSCLVLLFCLAACSLPDNTEALTKWYNSKDRTQIEKQINSLYKAQGLELSITVEEPDTIVYNFQYDASSYSFDESERDVLAALLKQSMPSVGSALKSDIAQYQDIYKLPVKVLRVAYLDPEGNIIYSMDIDENYEPSDDDLAEQCSTLEEWLGSAGKESFVSTLNSSLEQSGVTIDFGADGDTLVMIYRFVDQLDLSDYTQEDLDILQESFIEILVSSFGSNTETMSDYWETLLGFKIDSMKFQIKNADGSLIFDIPMSALQDAR